MKTSRRDFLKTASAASALAMAGGLNLNSSTVQGAPVQKDKLIWGLLLHLSYNMWCDVPVDSWARIENLSWKTWSDTLRFEESLWQEVTQKMADRGMNLVVIDVGDGVQFESHPEISVKGAWSKAKLHQELERCRKLGLEPIPKLNFSATHDIWLREYSRMLSTQKYYEVCSDLIKETLELFGKPRFLHLGYDEETYDHQSKFGYVVVRQGETWWKDFLFFTKTVEKNGSRPWIWADYYWHHQEEFLKRMPKSILMSNWYYDENFNPEEEAYVKAYLDLDRAGFEQIPTSSNWASEVSFQRTVDFCTQRLNPRLLKGFLQTSWKPTFEEVRSRHLGALEQVALAMKSLQK